MVEKQTAAEESDAESMVFAKGDDIQETVQGQYQSQCEEQSETTMLRLSQ